MSAIGNLKMIPAAGADRTTVEIVTQILEAFREDLLRDEALAERAVSGTGEGL